jgi:hypothetical protein
MIDYSAPGVDEPFAAWFLKRAEDKATARLLWIETSSPYYFLHQWGWLKQGRTALF